MQKSSFVTLVVLTSIVVSGVAYTYWLLEKRNEEAQNEARRALVSDEEAVPFTDLSGQEVTLETYLGSVLIINSWASWSPHSVDELSRMNELAAMYQNQPVVFLAINRSETKEETERFMRTVPALPYIDFILDPSDRFFKAVSGYAMPETIVYDAQGRLVHHVRGVTKNADLQTRIDAALNRNNDDS